MNRVSTFLLVLIIGLLTAGAGPTNRRAATAASTSAAITCGYNQKVAALLNEADPARWSDWVARLSGAKPILITRPGGGAALTRIQTRDTVAMFSGQPNALAYEYAAERFNEWFPPELVNEQTYSFFGQTARNLIATIPGKARPEEAVLITAHLDSTAWESAIAPGANDNATGVAAVLEAARVARRLQFEKTVRFILFTGEEAGLVGSRAYVAGLDPAVKDKIQVINLDMIGWDGDGDRCFEMDISAWVAASEGIAACLAEAIPAYNLNLSYDYLVAWSSGRSDQRSFWEAGIPAIGLHENASDQPQIEGCDGADRNPYYHTAHDTLAENVMLPYAFDIARGGLAAFAALAQPQQGCFSQAPAVDLVGDPIDGYRLQWEALPEAKGYRMYRSPDGCSGGWQLVETLAAGGSPLIWQDATAEANWPYAYQVEAIGKDGVCVSPPSACLQVGPPPPAPYHWMFLPQISVHP